MSFQLSEIQVVDNYFSVSVVFLILLLLLSCLVLYVQIFVVECHCPGFLQTQLHKKLLFAFFVPTRNNRPHPWEWWINLIFWSKFGRRRLKKVRRGDLSRFFWPWGWPRRRGSIIRGPDFDKNRGSSGWEGTQAQDQRRVQSTFSVSHRLRGALPYLFIAGNK